jgi:hypothetical protein
MKTQTVLDASRWIATNVVSYSVSISVGAAMVAITPQPNNLKKAAAFVAGYAIGSMAGEKAEEWTNDQFDKIESFVHKLENKNSVQ